MPKLKLFNGRGVKRNEHLSIGAHSRADASRMLVQVYGGTVSHWNNELRDYFSHCWGNGMADIFRDRGVWVATEPGTESESLRRVFPVVGDLGDGRLIYVAYQILSKLYYQDDWDRHDVEQFLRIARPVALGRLEDLGLEKPGGSGV